MSDAPVLPSSVRLEDGSGGLPRVVVHGPAATAEVYLQGGHVTAWRPSGHDDVLWTSARSRFAEGTAVRGGVPVCFPWFGPLEGHPDAPAHGFARTLPWTLDAVEESGGDVVVALSLTDSPATHSTPWPHPFRAELRVTVGARLTLALTVHNTGEHPVTFAEALHTYLGVGDVRQVEVGGLEGRRYIDKLGGPEPVDGSAEPARITGETDRIYLDTRGTTTVDDPAAGRRLDVTGEGAGTTVLWNPWTTKAAAMPDFGDDEWTGMVCVETCNVGPATVTLAPGASHTMTATMGVTAR